MVSTGSEREVLEAFLDLYRDVVTRKAAGLSSDSAGRRLVASSTTLAGIVKHLTSVEREWFASVLDQKPASEAGVRVADDGWHRYGDHGGVARREIRSAHERWLGYLRVLEARDATTSHDRLRGLARDVIRPVRLWTARNPNTPPDAPLRALLAMADGEAAYAPAGCFIVRHKVAHHPNTSADLRAHLLTAGVCQSASSSATTNICTGPPAGPSGGSGNGGARRHQPVPGRCAGGPRGWV